MCIQFKQNNYLTHLTIKRNNILIWKLEYGFVKKTALQYLSTLKKKSFT